MCVCARARFYIWPAIVGRLITSYPHIRTPTSHRLRVVITVIILTIFVFIAESWFLLNRTIYTTYILYYYCVYARALNQILMVIYVINTFMCIVYRCYGRFNTGVQYFFYEFFALVLLYTTTVVLSYSRRGIFKLNLFNDGAVYEEDSTALKRY